MTTNYPLSTHYLSEMTGEHRFELPSYVPAERVPSTDAALTAESPAGVDQSTTVELAKEQAASVASGAAEAAPDVARDDADRLLDALVLARDCQDSDAVRDAEQALVLHFRSFAAGLAAAFLRRGGDLEDLVQVAQMGLMKAVRGWKPQPSGGFLQYAKPTIVGELKRYFRDVAPMIRLPRHLQEVGSAVAVARRDLGFLSRIPTPDELAEAAGVPRRDVDADAVARRATDFTSLDAAPLDAVAPPSLDAERDLDAVELRTVLRAAVSCLSERERHLLALRYFQDLTQDEIGTRVGVSQMQVSRLLRGALSKLQQRLVA